MTDFVITPYHPSMNEEWNEFLTHVRQNTFLFNRNFMDYHADRFHDTSLIIRTAHGHPAALLPANRCPSDKRIVQSHGGLTYGGLLTPSSASTSDIGRMFQLCANHYAHKGYIQMDYKPVPHIYHAYPAEEDLYWLHRMGATLSSRAISSAIYLPEPLPLSTLRRRKVRKVERTSALTVSTSMDHLPGYWEVLTNVLLTRHDTRPVHSLIEITQLANAFPSSIQLFTALTSNGDIAAGCVLFITSKVVHIQYIAASDEGRALGALDWLFQHIIDHAREHYPNTVYLDFGISTEQQGLVLNEGLIFQKEGFGARGVCYDAYSLPLAPFS